MAWKLFDGLCCDSMTRPNEPVPRVLMRSKSSRAAVFWYTHTRTGSRLFGYLVYSAQFAVLRHDFGRINNLRANPSTRQFALRLPLASLRLQVVVKTILHGKYKSSNIPSPWLAPPWLLLISNAHRSLHEFYTTIKHQWRSQDFKVGRHTDDVARMADAGVRFLGRGSTAGPLPINYEVWGELSLPPLSPKQKNLLGFARILWPCLSTVGEGRVPPLWLRYC